MSKRRHAVELDDKMGGYPVQCRVVQNKEPQHFYLIFKGKFVVHQGGVGSGFKNRQEEDSFNTSGTRLFHVKASNECVGKHTPSPFVHGLRPLCCFAESHAAVSRQSEQRERKQSPFARALHMTMPRSLLYALSSLTLAPSPSNVTHARTFTL